MYAKIIDGVPVEYSLKQLYRDNRNVAFPEGLSDELLTQYGVHRVEKTDMPQHDFLTHKAAHQIVVLGNRLMQAWRVDPLPLSDAEKNVRAHRDNLLTKCDWTQAADAPVDQVAWAEYRQALRDITSQEGFPYSVSWPDAPRRNA